MTMIRISSLHQPTLDVRRDRLDEARIRHYIGHPDKISGVTVYENPASGERILVNGHHRVEAARRLDRTHIDAVLRAGTRDDATAYRDLDQTPWSEVQSEADHRGQTGD